MGNKLFFWQRLTRQIAMSRPGSWLFARILPFLDRLVMGWSGGRQSLASLTTGLPIIQVTTIGAKSGRPHAIPLVGVPHKGQIIVVASQWGKAKHPAWYWNMRANPQVTITQNGQEVRYEARQLSGRERELCWQIAVNCYAGYAVYAGRASQRTIPVLLLSKRS